MTLSRFDPGLTSVRPQKPRTSPFYSSMNGPGLKTLVPSMYVRTKLTIPKERSLIRMLSVIDCDDQFFFDK